ncbi:GlxA family transcriptional regulator [Hydrogenophaga defluvii]|uniref:GlxA family transcriptional regulator n=1 Tax=Hydrogenophaga defluvii TaxID=249410 RepID=A0ABW2S903_9BURK
MTPTPIPVYFVLLPDSLILDWAGPAEALRIANRCLVASGQPEAFAPHFIGPVAEAVSSVGATISCIQPLPAALPQPAWLVLLGQPGTTINPCSPGVPELLHWLRGHRLQTGQLELLTVCAGAVLAAHAGLLDGRRATTHHHHLEELQGVAPRCEVVSNRVFVLDGAVSSSAGVTTGIDLFLHHIARVCGPAIAAQVAQSMVVALRRGPGDPELSPFLRHRNHLHAALHRVQDAISGAPQNDWTLSDMADVAHTSPRHLSRVFAAHTGITPLQYLRDIRLAVAEAALIAGRNVTQSAALAGFASDTQLRRAWRQQGKRGTPSTAGQ